MTRNYEELRPHPEQLRLLLRAAVPEAGNDVWLYVARDLTGKVLRPYIHTGYTHGAYHRLDMISGADALAFAHEHNWADIMNPTIPELRGLMVHCMLSNDAVLWLTAFDQWDEWVNSPEAMRKRIEREDHARSLVRGLRWKWAEQWLAHA